MGSGGRGLAAWLYSAGVCIQLRQEARQPYHIVLHPQNPLTEKITIRPNDNGNCYQRASRKKGQPQEDYNETSQRAETAA
jgi:hypothetical protein